MAQEFDYSTYVVDYFGILDEDEFDRYSKKALAFISNITMGRSDAETDERTVDLIRIAACEIMSIMVVNDNEGGGVISESNDGVSVTYASSKDTRTAAARYADVAQQYLSSTGLLYRGVRRC